MKPATRRDFLRTSLIAAASLSLVGAGCSGPAATPDAQQSPANTPLPAVTKPVEPMPTSVPVSKEPPAPASDQAYLAVMHGADPEAITKAAIAALGGIERFMKKGANVIIKPNICTDYHTYEYATTTNPIVVATLVRLCLGAGAGRVRVMDMPFGGTPESAYAISGIADAVKAAGGEMEVMSLIKFPQTDIPQGKAIKKFAVYKDILEADLVINVPIAKDHSLARLTLGMKNLFGVTGAPSLLHSNLGQRTADITSLVRPALTVVDAVRILTSNGPTGGSLDSVKLTNMVIASHDIVAADAYATTLFGLIGADIDTIQAGADMGLGTMDLKSIKLVEENV